VGERECDSTSAMAFMLGGVAAEKFPITVEISASLPELNGIADPNAWRPAATSLLKPTGLVTRRGGTRSALSSGAASERIPWR
jgi:hypothetical protein